MEIEERIKQKRFESELEKAVVSISYTNSYIAGTINSSFKKHNISLQQYNVLRILRGQHPNPVSINEITLRMVDKMSNASRLVEKLFNKGLVAKEACSYDKRQLDILLTNQGQKLLLELDHSCNEAMSLFDNLTEDEFVNLNYLLGKILP